MQVLKRRNNKRITLSLFQSSWHILSIQNGNASSCCVVFLPWTFIPESSKIRRYCFSNIYVFSSALNKVVPTLLSSGISRALRVPGIVTWAGSSRARTWVISPRGAMGLDCPFTSSCLGPWRPTAGSEEASSVDGVCSWLWTRTVVLPEVKSRAKSLPGTETTASCKQLQPEETLLVI